VGVVDVEVRVSVLGGELLCGEKEDVVSAGAGVEEGRFAFGGSRRYERDASGGAPAGAEAVRLVLVDVLDPYLLVFPVDFLSSSGLGNGHERVRAVEEQATFIGEVARLIQGG
jgi:hypothetical protein